MKSINMFKDIIIPFAVSISVEICMLVLNSKINNVEVINIFLCVALFALITFIIIYRLLNKQQIIRVFPNQEQSKKDTIKASKKSNKIIFFGIKGNLFSHLDGFLNKFLSYNKVDKKIILSDPNNMYMEERSKDIKVDVVESYKSDIKSSISIINSLSNNKHIQLLLHNENPLFQHILLDNYMYLPFYHSGQTISKSKVYKVAKGSELYKIFEKHSNSYA